MKISVKVYRGIKCLLFAFIIMLTLGISGCKNENITKLKNVLNQCSMYDDLKQNILVNARSFLTDFDDLLKQDNDDLLHFVDKQHHLEASFVPADLVNVYDKSYLKTNRNGHMLRQPVLAGLDKMCQAAYKDGIVLLVSSTYRSYEYQKNLYRRYCTIYGKEQTDTFSAKEGTSQHQLGVAIDFGNIDDSFALTKESRWLEENAKNFGFSLSFPKDMSHITGFKWECWHYRYIGQTAVDMQQKWFGDIQQFLIEFVYQWRNYRPNN